MHATTSAPTRQRKQRVKPARSIRLEVRPEGNATGVVRITIGQATQDYFLNVLPADFGKGFRIEKIGLHETEPPYHVNIEGNHRSCDCKGHLKWGRCKHADGLAALIAAGRL